MKPRTISRRVCQSRKRRGAAMTVLVVAVLAAAMVGLTLAATSMVTARTEQLRRGRASEIQRMLDAGRQWVQAGGLGETPDPDAEATVLQLPSFATESQDSAGSGSPTSGIEKTVEIQLEPDDQIRITATLQRVRNDKRLVLATRTIRFTREPADATNNLPADQPQPDPNDSEPVGADADEPDASGDN